MISNFDLIALLLSLSALFGWINHRFIRLPHTIGLLVMGLFASLLLVLLELAYPQEQLYEQLSRTLQEFDFTGVVMEGMLGFLLFAGALTVDFDALRSRAGPVAFLALAGTLISTAVVGTAFWWVANAIGSPVPFAWALVFGALISPTDPVAVLSTLKHVNVPAPLQAEIQGESLFNDGIGIVVFTLLVGVAAGTEGGTFSASDAARHLVQEAAGGLALGALTGYLAYRMMRAIDDFGVEVLITLALVSGTYALAHQLGASGPLSVVASGLLIGNRARRYAMSERTEGYVTSLWTVIDEVLNSVLFLLIGLEVLVLNPEPGALLLAALAVPIVLAGRLVAVSTPLLVPWAKRLSARNVPFLVWAGVRGGISVALALSLPADAAKSTILAATYAVVLFTVIVQGSTLATVARYTIERDVTEDVDNG